LHGASHTRRSDGSQNPRRTPDTTVPGFIRCARSFRPSRSSARTVQRIRNAGLEAQTGLAFLTAAQAHKKLARLALGGDEPRGQHRLRHQEGSGVTAGAGQKLTDGDEEAQPIHGDQDTAMSALKRRASEHRYSGSRQDALTTLSQKCTLLWECKAFGR
jgi:hypothetical protein